jgi:2-hydroxymuconate-semialdehyde hydrolase
MTWVRALRADQLGETTASRFVRDGQAFCVALADGRPRAVDDQCPHREVALSGGLVSGGVITCPGHFRRFDLRTGRCVGRAWESVRSYECAVIDGWVHVDIGPPPPRQSLRELLLSLARGNDRG